MSSPEGVVREEEEVDMMEESSDVAALKERIREQDIHTEQMEEELEKLANICEEQALELG